MTNEKVNNHVIQIAHERELMLTKWQELRKKWMIINAITIIVSLVAAIIMDYIAEINGWQEEIAVTPFLLLIVIIVIGVKKGIYSCPFCHISLGRYRRKDGCCKHCGEKIL